MNKKIPNAFCLIFFLITASVTIADNSTPGTTDPTPSAGSSTKITNVLDTYPQCGGDKSPWCNTFFFGVQFLPDYEDGEDGTFNGISKPSFFGQFKFDAIKKRKYFNKNQLDHHLDHFGFNVTLFDSGSIEEGTEPNIENLQSFNQISNTLSIEGYYSVALESNLVTDNIGSVYGPRFILGAITRDETTANQDTLTSYASIGLQYQFYDRLPSITETTAENTVPVGEFYLGLAHFENWGNQENDISDIAENGRIIFRGTYNFGERFFMGLYINGGKGPDDISILFGAKRTTKELLNFLGIFSVDKSAGS